MTNLIAHLNDAAFQSLLISSIETFPSGDIGGKAAPVAKPNKSKQQHEGESFGLLFGQRILKKRCASRSSFTTRHRNLRIRPR